MIFSTIYKHRCTDQEATLLWISTYTLCTIMAMTNFYIGYCLGMEGIGDRISFSLHLTWFLCAPCIARPPTKIFQFRGINEMWMNYECYFENSSHKELVAALILTQLASIRKSKDYVYGIWVYKVLGIPKGYYRVKKSLVSYMKPWTEAINNKCMKYHSKITYQLSFWNVSRKVDYHAGGKWLIHGPERRKENQLLSM